MIDATLLTAKAIENLTKAYAPYSEFQVSAAARVRDMHGQHHLAIGVNVENMINRMSVCAETSLISNIYSQFGDAFTIEEIVVVGPHENLISPCGACRATLHEHVAAGTLVNGKPLSYLYPHAPSVPMP